MVIAALIIGILALSAGILALPAVFQMWWGRPVLRTRFENGVKEADRFLPVYLENPPVKNKILRKFGVHQDTIQSLTVQFCISEVGSGKIIIPSRQARIFSDDDPTQKGINRIALPPTFSVAASIMVVMWNAKSNKAMVLPDGLRDASELMGGAYRVHIIFSVDGEPKIVSRQFIVGKKADDLTWVNSS